MALVVADRLARSLTRPVTDLATTALRLGSGDLTARVTPDGPVEVREVGTALNRLAGRIGELLTAERESAADLAHRLRTPLTALRLDAEALPAAADRERLLDDVDALSRGVDEVISEARRTVREGLGAGCDAVAVLADRVRFWSVLAEEEQRDVGVQLAEGPLPVRVAAADLGAAVDALLGNVFAHTPEGTGFRVAVRPRDGGGAVVTVADRGPGMTDDAVGRGHSGGGSTGLGLDIARRTAEGSGGRLRLAASATGTDVTLELGPPAGQ
nr:sensor histidine kinase [Geodermatophilus sabuli]